MKKYLPEFEYFTKNDRDITDQTCFGCKEVFPAYVFNFTDKLCVDCMDIKDNEVEELYFD